MNKNNSVELVTREDVVQEFGESAASAVSADKVVTWAKFVLTDDKPNGNRERIPEEEFDNIIKTGVYKPVKMAIGEIKDGHEDAQPLGVITHLSREANRIIGLAALWEKEREDDVNYIKTLVKGNKPVNVSWEVLYGNSVLKDGIYDLIDTALRAVTIVGIPAYAGRTQFIAVAANKWNQSYIGGLPDSSFLHIGSDGSRLFPYRDHTGKIDVKRFPVIMEEISESHLPENTLKSIRKQIKKMSSVINADASLRELLDAGDDINLEDSKLDTKELEGKVSELEAKLSTAGAQISEKEAAVQEAVAKLEEANKLLGELQVEIEPLRQFKSEIDQASEREAKLSTIKEKFTSLKLEKSDEYFVDNADKLLSLSEGDLDFMLQELVAFKDSDPGTDGDSEAGLRIPNVLGQGGELDIKNIAQALRERNKK